MTQGQWKRLVGEVPSFWNPERRPNFIDWTHPVGGVNWNECKRLLRRLDLDLPSEAQWEYGARAGTSTPYACPMQELGSHENTGDAAYKSAHRALAFTDPWSDGFAYTAPVGSLEPNALGLHDMQGNVREWCLDGYHEYFYVRSPWLDPVNPPHEAFKRVARGGCYDYSANIGARSAARSEHRPDDTAAHRGFRPARAIDPE